MATRTTKQPKPHSDLIASQFFAQCFCAYLECSAEMQEVIRDMTLIVNDPEADDDERQAALATMAEALFPSGVNGSLGVDLEESEEMDTDEGKAILASMDQEEETFAERLFSLLKQRGMTQSDLAAAIGVRQPAISMMLARNCRPQRRTVKKIAEALEVAPESLWPGFKEE